MDAALRLGLWHALYAVYARFVFERAVDVLPRDFEDDLLVASRGTVRERCHFVAPALRLDVFGIHAQQVAGEDGRLVAARPAADLHDGVLRVLRVFGDQQQFDLLFHLLDGRLQFGDLAASHFAHLLVLVVGEDVLGFGQVGQRRAVAFRGFDDRLQLLVLLVELHELFDVGDDFGVGEFLPRLLVFEFQAVETAQNAVVCHKSLILPAKIRNNRQTAMRRLKKRGCASPWGDYCPAGQSDSRRERTCWPNSCTAACTTASASSLPALLRLVAGRIPTSTQPGRPGCRRSTEAGFYASFSFFSQSSIACCHCSLYSKWSRMPQPCPPVE